jgi:AmiR/NasT family two-component response regulator
MGMIEMDGVKTTDDARDRRIAELVDEVDGLRAAMANRAAIEQAKGLIIAARGCTPDEAFELLSRMSQNENRKLRDVAASLVESAQRPKW